MNSQLSDHGSAPDLTSRIAGVAHSHSTIEWLLTAALGLAAVSAALDRQSWPTAGFAAIGAAALLRTLRLSDRSRVWRWLVYLLLAFSIALYALRVALRLRHSVSAKPALAAAGAVRFWLLLLASSGAPQQKRAPLGSIGLLAIALVVAAPPTRLSAQREHPSGIPVDLVVPFAPRPVNAEGTRHLVYELHITNFGRGNLTLERIDVLTAGGESVLATYSNESLSGVLSRPGIAALAEKRILGPGLRAVAFIDVVTPVVAPTPRQLRHRLTFAPVTPPDAPLQSIVEGGDVDVAPTGPVALGPPLSGSGWLALHGLSNESSHRRTLLAIDGRARIAQRFAIDWTRVAPDGQVFHGDPSKNANWSPYGADVLAVGNGRVVEIRDGIPENDPTSETRAVPITLTTVGGNYVILDLGRGRYAFYAHLQPGSFCVRRGDRVRRGQVLAKLGNSGQADAPHLHLHIVDAPAPLAAEGIPMAFDRFVIQGHVGSLKVLTDGTGWMPTAQPLAVLNEMSVENVVVAFPARRTQAQCSSK